MTICKRLVTPDDHLQPQKGHGNCIFETPHNEIKCVLSVEESSFNEKRSKFSHLLTVRAEVTDPPLPQGAPLTVSLTVKYPLFLTPCLTRSRRESVDLRAPSGRPKGKQNLNGYVPISSHYEVFLISRLGCMITWSLWAGIPVGLWDAPWSLWTSLSPPEWLCPPHQTCNKVSWILLHSGDPTNLFLGCSSYRNPSESSDGNLWTCLLG